MKDFTPPKTFHHVSMKQASHPYYSLLLAISEDSGVEHFEIYDKAVNQDRFMHFLDQLYIINKHNKIAVFMDNLSSHKTPRVLMKLKELEIEAIYNVPYMPDFNPCECCFLKTKNYFRRQKLNLLVNNQEVNFKDLVK